MTSRGSSYTQRERFSPQMEKTPFAVSPPMVSRSAPARHRVEPLFSKPIKKSRDPRPCFPAGASEAIAPNFRVYSSDWKAGETPVLIFFLCVLRYYRSKMTESSGRTKTQFCAVIPFPFPRVCGIARRCKGVTKRDTHPRACFDGLSLI